MFGLWLARTITRCAICGKVTPLSHLLHNDHFRLRNTIHIQVDVNRSVQFAQMFTENWLQLCQRNVSKQVIYRGTFSHTVVNSTLVSIQWASTPRDDNPGTSLIEFFMMLSERIPMRPFNQNGTFQFQFLQILLLYENILDLSRFISRILTQMKSFDMKEYSSYVRYC